MIHICSYEKDILRLDFILSWEFELQRQKRKKKGILKVVVSQNNYKHTHTHTHPHKYDYRHCCLSWWSIFLFQNFHLFNDPLENISYSFAPIHTRSTCYENCNQFHLKVFLYVAHTSALFTIFTSIWLHRYGFLYKTKRISVFFPLQMLCLLCGVGFPFGGGFFFFCENSRKVNNEWTCDDFEHTICVKIFCVFWVFGVHEEKSVTNHKFSNPIKSFTLWAQNHYSSGLCVCSCVCVCFFHIFFCSIFQQFENKSSENLFVLYWIVCIE